MKKKLTKLMISVLASAMIMTSLPVNMLSVQAERIAGEEVKSVSDNDMMKSGTLGDNGDVQWTYNEDIKTLTVSGEDSGVNGKADEESPFDNICWDVEKIIFRDCKLVGDVDYLLGHLILLKEVEFTNFDTSEVTSMSNMFYYCGYLESLDVRGFDTGNITDMSNMFAGCKSLKNLDVSGFNTSNVTDMSGMFYDCEKLGSLDVSGFDTSKVTNMSKMFSGCSSLTGLNISGFDTSKVTDTYSMFTHCKRLKSLDISSFDTSNVANMGFMFGDCGNLESLDVSGFDTTNVTNMEYLFYGDSKLKSLDVSGFDTSNVTNMYGMFYNCTNLTGLDVSGFDTRNVTDMGVMFGGCNNLEVLSVSGFDTSDVTDMHMMFYACSKLESLDVSGFDTGNVTKMNSMFENCSKLKSIDVSGFDTSNVKDMLYMFSACSNLESLDLSKFDTSKITEMYYMFYGCSNLKSLDVSSFDTSNVTNMVYLFKDCSNLESLNISSFDTSKTTRTDDMFSGCPKLRILYTPKIMAEGQVIELSNTLYDSRLNSVNELTSNHCNTILAEEWDVYSITYVLNGGVQNASNPATYRWTEEDIVLAEPSRVGYQFEGWYHDADFAERVDVIPAKSTGNITLYARWSADNYTISYNLNDGANNSNNPSSYTVESSTITLQNPTRTGYTFGGWYLDEEFENPIQEIRVGTTGDLVLHAKWIAEEYTITYHLSGGENHPDNPATYTLESDTIILKEAMRTGWSFRGWLLLDKESGDTTSIEAINAGSKGNIELVAVWSPNQYTVTYELNGGTNSSTNPGSYTVNDAIVFGIPTRKNYVFAGWYTDAEYTNSMDRISAGTVGNLVLYAKWLVNTYHISFHGNGATSGEMNNLSNCKYGTPYKLTPNAYKRAGYTFTGWNTKADGKGTKYGDKESVKNLTSTNGKTITLYAQWKKNTYKITYKLNSGKNSKSNPATYTVASTITLKNPTRTGYTFAGWYSDSKYKTKVTKISKGSTGHKVLYAKWTPNKYIIKFDKNGATSGKMSAMKNRKYGSQYTLSKNTFKRKGYTFTGWNTKKNGKGKTYKNKAKVSNLVSKNGSSITLYAQWKKDTYKITYKLNGGKNSKSNPKKYTVTMKTTKLKAPTRKGYTFKGWYQDKKFKKKVTQIKKGSTGNITLYAKWVKKK